MNRIPAPQEGTTDAVDNYFALSNVLLEDLNALLESRSDAQHWRRNFIRASVALIEGYAHCLRELCRLRFEWIGAPAIGKKEERVLRSEKEFEAHERIKLTLRAAYSSFELQPAPNFGGPEWCRMKCVLNRRNRLMHPKSPADLELSDDLFNELWNGVYWLIEQCANFNAGLKKENATRLTELEELLTGRPAPTHE